MERKSGKSEFSKIIKQLRQTKPSNMGRGGPNFVNNNPRQNSAAIYEGVQNIKQVVDGNPFVSSDVQRFVVNNRDNSLGNTMHSPSHNRVDSIRDDSVYKSVGGDKSQSGVSAGLSGNGSFAMTTASSNLSKFKVRLQN